MSKSMIERIAAARAALGETEAETPESALERERAEAAERYVADLERKAQRKVEAQRAAEEREATRAAEIEARRNEVVPGSLWLSRSEAHDLIALAALRKCSTNDLVVEALSRHLAKRAALPVKSGANNGIEAPLGIGVKQHVTADFWEIAKSEPHKPGQHVSAADVMIAAVRAWLVAALAEVDAADLRLVRDHHRDIRDSYRVDAARLPVGVDADAVKRYNVAVGEYADQYVIRRHVALETRDAMTQHLAEQDAAARRLEEARRTAAVEKIAAERAQAARLKALIA